MADTGFVFPGTAVGNRTITGSDADWSSEGNITADDASDATWPITTTQRQSSGLAGSNFDFSGASGTIDGIEIEVGDYQTGFDIQNSNWDVVRLILADDSDGSTNKSADLLDPTNSDQTDQVGGASDLWDETINLSDVQDADWGFFIGFGGRNVDFSQDLLVNYFKMKVYYTLGGPQPGVGALTLAGSVPVIPPSIEEVNSGAAWTDGDTNINITGQFLF